MPKKSNPQLVARKSTRKKRFYIDNELLSEYASVSLSPHAIAVYGVLAKHAHHEKQICWPSQNTIKEQSGVGSKNTVVKCLKDLEELNIIHIKRQNGKSNLYTLIDQEYWKAPEAIEKCEDKANTSTNSDTGDPHQNQYGGSADVEGGSTNSGTQNHINNSNNLNNNDKERKKESIKDVSWILDDAKEEGIFPE